MLINVINTDGAQPGVRISSALQNITLEMYTYCDHSVQDKLIFTWSRSLIQNPFDKHQDNHVEKQPYEEEQLR